MPLDLVQIHVRAGAGGNGVVSFRREKYVPLGGPDGGDGGKGGSIYLEADSRVTSLQAFRRRRHFAAGRGRHGEGNNRHGRDGEDIIVRVPVGTVVKNESGEVLADLTNAGERVLVARGGRGGWGNAHFASATNQAPRIALPGQPGEEGWLVVELKMIADVGLVGLPNVGKSTLLARVSAARPKIADYPFTTLEPCLGVVEVGDWSFILADIPGLIQGAHRGAGLGHDFLRHIERTRYLVYLIDGSREEPMRDYEEVCRELFLYDPSLAARGHVVAVNKVDLPEVRARASAILEAFMARGLEALVLSALTGEGIPGLLEILAQRLGELSQPDVEEGFKVFRPQPRGRG